MTITRRDFIRAMALKSAAAAAATMFPGISFAGWQPTDFTTDSIVWSKTHAGSVVRGAGFLRAFPTNGPWLSRETRTALSTKDCAV